MFVVFVCLAVSRFRGRVGLQCVNEDEVGDANVDSQTGVYDNIDNVQQQVTQQRRRARRDQCVNHVAAASGAVDVDGTTAVGDSGAAAGAARTETASNSMLTGDIDGWTTNVRRRGRCADRTVSNRIVGPSFVSSARVQLGGVEMQHQKQQKQQQEQQSELISSGHTADARSTETLTPKTHKDSPSTAVSDNCIQTANQSKSEPPWNGYDNIMELKEAINSSAAAKMAAGSRTKGSESTAAPSGGVSANLGLVSHTVPRSRAVGERVVDVRRQRLSATGRELTTTSNGVQTSTASAQTEAAAETLKTVTMSPENDTAPATPVEGTPAQKQSSNCDTTPADVEGLHTTDAGSSVTDSGSLPKKKTVYFEKEDTNSNETESTTGKGRKLQNKDKPPIGKSGNDASRKAESKSELQRKKKKKETKSVATPQTVSEQPDGVDGRTEQTVSKISFLKSLLTRSRSPSPKRAPTVSSNKPESPSSPRGDVAKRLSDPLKSSFKEAHDGTVVKIFVKHREKKKKRQPSATESSSEQTSDFGDRSNCKDVSVTNSADELIDETLAPPSSDEVKPSPTLTADDHDDFFSPSTTENPPEATNGNVSNSETKMAVSTSTSSVPCHFTESTIATTSIQSTTPPETVAVCSTSSDVATEKSPERRRSATVITLHSTTTGNNETTSNNRVSDDQATAASTPSRQPRNPWIVNLKEVRLRPNLDSFEGEKVVSSHPFLFRQFLFKRVFEF